MLILAHNSDCLSTSLCRSIALSLCWARQVAMAGGKKTLGSHSFLQGLLPMTEGLSSRPHLLNASPRPHSAPLGTKHLTQWTMGNTYLNMAPTFAVPSTTWAVMIARRTRRQEELLESCLLFTDGIARLTILSLQNRFLFCAIENCPEACKVTKKNCK